MKPLLLDTEVLIWWDADDKRLGPNARARIRDAGDVYVSAASAWEISIKVALGQLQTGRQPSEAEADADFRMLPVTFEHAEAVLGLPASSRSLRSIDRGRRTRGTPDHCQQRQPAARLRRPAHRRPHLTVGQRLREVAGTVPRSVSPFT